MLEEALSIELLNRTSRTGRRLASTLSSRWRTPKLQISPLRYAPVKMTELLHDVCSSTIAVLLNEFVISTGAYLDFLPR
jgi:hypothetical protein